MKISWGSTLNERTQVAVRIVLLAWFRRAFGFLFRKLHPEQCDLAAKHAFILSQPSEDLWQSAATLVVNMSEPAVEHRVRTKDFTNLGGAAACVRFCTVACLYAMFSRKVLRIRRRIWLPIAQ